MKPKFFLLSTPDPLPKSVVIFQQIKVPLDAGYIECAAHVHTLKSINKAIGFRAYASAHNLQPKNGRAFNQLAIISCQQVSCPSLYASISGQVYFSPDPVCLEAKAGNCILLH